MSVGVNPENQICAYCWEKFLMAMTVWILGDQLLIDHPALAHAEQGRARQDVLVLMIESQAQTHRMPYHAKKMTLLLSAMRHYAKALREAGYRLDYRMVATVAEGVMGHLQEFKPDSLISMEASSARGREFQRSLAAQFGMQTVLVPNTQFLSSGYNPLPDASPDQSIRQEQFYRKMRQHFELLIDDDGEPVGGIWNYDQKNRQPLPKKLSVPKILGFDHDPMTLNVMEAVSQNYPVTGNVTGFDLAVTHEDARRAAEDFLNQRLPNFGTYEDGMRQTESVLFHSKLAAYLNVGLLDPLDLVKAAEQCYYDGTAAINNVEGFIRQVIGWREYMYWQYHRLMPALAQGNYWDATHPLPGFFWKRGGTKLNCLGTVIDRVLESGYAHHIERLMVLSNFCLLAGIDPQAVYKWFSCAFIDAYEWVMVPNVFGMGLFADGGKVATKPYVASANYINRMSDYCNDCTYDKKPRTGAQACPYNFLYWHFLLTHQEKLAQNPRMARMLYNLRHLDEAERDAVRDQANGFLAGLV
jgi:deoxyribodipyrimidine photolyase-related protein